MTSATPKPRAGEHVEHHTQNIYYLTHAEVRTLTQGGTISIPSGSLIAIPSPNHPRALATPESPGAETDAESVRFGRIMIDWHDGTQTVTELVPADFARKLEAERDSLAAQNRELVKALDLTVRSLTTPRGQNPDTAFALNTARPLLAKHGR